MNTAQRLKKLIQNSYGIEENQKAPTLAYLESIADDEQALSELEQLILAVEQAKYNQLKAELKSYQLAATIIEAENQKKKKNILSAKEQAERQEEESQTNQLLSQL